MPPTAKTTQVSFVRNTCSRNWNVEGDYHHRKFSSHVTSSNCWREEKQENKGNKKEKEKGIVHNSQGKNYVTRNTDHSVKEVYHMLKTVVRYR